MVSDYSPRYRGKIKQKPGRPKPTAKQKISCGPWFWKLAGVLVVVATMVGIAGSLWFSWKIRRGLDDLALAQEKGNELQRVSLLLHEEEKVFFSKERIEAMSIEELSLYPPKEKSLGGGITVRVSRP